MILRLFSMRSLPFLSLPSDVHQVADWLRGAMGEAIFSMRVAGNTLVRSLLKP
jgi:hypothetical protein